MNYESFLAGMSLVLMATFMAACTAAGYGTFSKNLVGALAIGGVLFMVASFVLSIASDWPRTEQEADA